MGIETALGVGASLVGGAMGSSGAKSAAKAQQKAADAATAEQRRQYDQTRADNQPWMQAGTGGINMLSYLLGIPGYGASGAYSAPKTREQLREELIGSYSTPGNWSDVELAKRDRADIENYFKTANRSKGDTDIKWNPNWDIYFPERQGFSFRSMADFKAPNEIKSAVDEAALNRAIEERLAQQEAAMNAAQNDPNFGSLLRSFSQQDLDNDVVYNTGLQFGMDEGVKGLNRIAAASGGFQSGAAAKAIARFANDYGTTKAEGAYNRFNNDKTNIYNRLAGIANVGQVANNQVATAGQNMANNVSNNLIGAGNSRAASAIGSANSWSNALSGGMNAWQQNKLYDQMSFNPSTPGYGGYNEEMARIQGMY